MTDGRTLTLRDLNRALLARQRLLEPAPAGTPVAQVVAETGGIQSQVLLPSFLGIRTRMAQVTAGEVLGAIEAHEVVRVAAMRNTLHLMAGEEYARLYGALEPALQRALRAFFGKRAQGLDAGRLTAAAKGWLEEEPLTYAELKRRLAELEPDRDPEALGYCVRSHLALVQAPNGKAFGFGTAPSWALPAGRVAAQVVTGDDAAALVRRYLGAFGPATIADVRAWTGRTGLQDVVEGLAGELVVHRTEDGTELLDLPDAPLPPGDTEVRPLLVAEYDNLVLGHADRTRVISGDDRKRIFLSAGRVRPTILVDGFVAGAWKVEKAGKGRRIALEPFGRLAKADRAQLDEQAEALLDWLP